MSTNELRIEKVKFTGKVDNDFQLKRQIYINSSSFFLPCVLDFVTHMLFPHEGLYQLLDYKEA